MFQEKKERRQHFYLANLIYYFLTFLGFKEYKQLKEKHATDLQKVATGATGGRGKFSYSGKIWGNSSFSHQETVIFPH